jgi:hypothetical protein
MTNSFPFTTISRAVVEWLLLRKLQYCRLSAPVGFLSQGAEGMAAPKRSRTKIGFKTQYFEYRIEGGKSWIPFR